MSKVVGFLKLRQIIGCTLAGRHMELFLNKNYLFMHILDDIFNSRVYDNGEAQNMFRCLDAT